MAESGHGLPGRHVADDPADLLLDEDADRVIIGLDFGTTYSG